MPSLSPLIAITKSLAWLNGRPTMLENCSLVNRMTSVSLELTEVKIFVPVWTRLAVRDTEGYSDLKGSPSLTNCTLLPFALTSIPNEDIPRPLT